MERGAPSASRGTAASPGLPSVALEISGFSGLSGKDSCELDLKDRLAVFNLFAETRPRYVVLTAAKVGGILANNT